MHLPLFKNPVPDVIVADATALVKSYPTLSDMSDGAAGNASARDWLLGSSCPAEMAPTSRADAFANTWRFLTDLRSPRRGSRLDVDRPEELVRQVFHVLRHLPEDHEVMDAAKSAAPLVCWIELEFLPPWWECC